MDTDSEVFFRFLLFQNQLTADKLILKKSIMNDLIRYGIVIKL